MNFISQLKNSCSVFQTARSAKNITLGMVLSSCFFHSLATAEAMVKVSAFEMPKYSAYLSPETIAGMKKHDALMEKALALCTPWSLKTGKAIRQCEAKMYPPIMAEAKKIYPVEIKQKTIDGVYTHIITPAEGIPDKNKNRVLINLHGGAFKYGSRFGGQLEAMPLAAIGKYKVVAIDYAKAPEHQFPAANLDVEKVYKALLTEYKPDNIGIYGCSAGSRLTGEVIAWFKHHNIAQPGAIGLLCSPPTRLDGDSNYYAAAFKNQQPLTIKQVEYWQGVKPDNALAFPGESMQMLKAFPPSILMTSSRDYSLSPMISMHNKLTRLGKTSELHIFEGFGHAKFLNMYIPEAKQAAQLLSQFFDQHLAD